RPRPPPARCRRPRAALPMVGPRARPGRSLPGRARPGMPPRGLEDLAAIPFFSSYLIIIAIENLAEHIRDFPEDFRGFPGFWACVACPAHGRLVFRIRASAAPKDNGPRGGGHRPRARPLVELAP